MSGHIAELESMPLESAAVASSFRDALAESVFLEHSVQDSVSTSCGATFESRQHWTQFTITETPQGAPF